MARVNVASLLLARATVRSREFAVRAALGASRGQLVRALLVESVLLSSLGAIAGLAVARGAIGLVKAALPQGIARASAITLDWRVVGAAMAATLATGIAFGAAPAWQASRADLVAALRDGTRTIAGVGRRRLRDALVVAEVAFVAVLLVAMALFVTSFVRITHADLGFERQNLVAFDLSIRTGGKTPVEQAENGARKRAVLAQAIERARAVPGVVDAGIISGGLPLSGSYIRYSIEVQGRQRPAEEMADLRQVTPGYFATAGMRLIRGRLFEDRDELAGAVPVVILNETAARQYFGGREALGATVGLRGGAPAVVGIVADVRLGGPEIDLRAEAYLPLGGDASGSSQLVVRTAGPPAALVPSIRAAIGEVLSPGELSSRTQIVEDLFRVITADRRFNAGLMTLFGVLGLLIGAAGIYAVMAFVVAQQTRDIGVRMALGAAPGRVLRGVLAHAGAHLAVGLVVGLTIAWAASRFIASLLFGVQATDPLVYVSVAALLAGDRRPHGRAHPCPARLARRSARGAADGVTTGISITPLAA